MKKRKLPECLLWDIQQVGAAIGVSIRTVQYMSKADRLPGFCKLNGRPRWQRIEIEKWIAEGMPERRNMQNHAIENSADDDDSEADNV
jgi:predicted DNA-binding transcriptional regulator AlpA